MNISVDQLSRSVGCNIDRAARWLSFIQNSIDKFDISNSKRIAAFFAQIGVESAYLSKTEENLNYSDRGLLATFHTHFTQQEAEDYARQPQRIANRVYANRCGNGDEKSGDGWNYRGRGLIEITFIDNYRACGIGCNLDLINYPELLTVPANAALSAAWYFNSRGCNELADADYFDEITQKINGGQNGAAQRRALWTRAKSALSVI